LYQHHNNRRERAIKSFYHAETGIGASYDVCLKNPVRPDIDVPLIYGGLNSPGIYQYTYTFVSPPCPSDQRQLFFPFRHLNVYDNCDPGKYIDFVYYKETPAPMNYPAAELRGILLIKYIGPGWPATLKKTSTY